ncbi:uncharacterized protein BN604_02720 [Bacteroides intestinalis CAG:315]|nr:uncharacterized protein BN604_02720 [Bacteroides intestinalis CAG:315]
MHFNIFSRLFSGDERTVLANKNILATGSFKVLDTLVYLLLVPATLGYLNVYEYGIWLTINSVLGWINSFDIGLGNGLRNQLAEALAKNDFKKGRSLISTTLVMLIAIMIVLILVVSIAFPYLDNYTIFGTNPEQVPNLNAVIFVSFIIFCVNFILKIIGNVYLALQLPAINYGMSTGGHLLSLIIIVILTHVTDGSLLYVAVAYSIAPTLVYLIAFPITFLGKYKDLSPQVGLFCKDHVNGLMFMGAQFFVLQIASIVLFAMTNLIISHHFGPEKVTEYNIAFRLFYLVVNFTMLVLSPMWSAATDAYARGDIEWINKSVRRIQKLLILIGVGLILMVFVSKYIYQIWVGEEVTVSFGISAGLAIYVYILLWSQAYSFFLNGMGKLKIQMVNTVLMSIIFYPLCMLFKEVGTLGVVVAMCLVNISGLVFNIIQFNKVVSGQAAGIWKK